ncbi:MAG: FAD-binding protein [candidate division WOR-3 bacterium]|jgi:succinate dehydrogenase / fumarate reductase flavoprotein subunit|nr:FAD-binding protein [candidate division WOR-3 bacterium]MCR4423612.1 FAD-binding protein [candidate division WOR-3 bacterium]MDH7518951.1 FAD-binding protein [bacterium]
MAYPSPLNELATRVAQTRPERLKQSFPRLNAEEKNKLLHEYHPDYRTDTFSTLRVGPNAGDRTPRELAILLEGESLLKETSLSINQPDYDCDVLVIGGGGAGCAAALIADDLGAKVIVATKLRLGDANTMMAQGGIQAADKDNDSPALHYLDVLGGGHFANTPELVETLVTDAPEAIQWLEDLGVMFDKNPDGSMKTIHGGGTSRKRMHTARDYTGAEIMRTLRDELKSRPQITVLEFSPAIELLTDSNGTVTGAVLLNLNLSGNALSPNYHYTIVRAKTVVIATGGSGRLHYQGFPTSNHYGATGDGLVLAYRAGARLAFIDTMQYHPTGVAYPQQIIGQLVTEKVRSLGAQLLNVDGQQFIFPLETRDVVASAIIRECQKGKGVVTPGNISGVWLDTPMIEILRGPGTVKRELPAMVRQFARFGIELDKEPILVYPTLHYQNGGVAIDPDCRTNVPFLFVAGEASGGVHGRNRLMGNSLLDVIVFGRRAGNAAAQTARTRTANLELTLKHLEKWDQELQKNNLAPVTKSPLILPDYTKKEV